MMIASSVERTEDRRWERARQLSTRPVRLLHRGSIEPKNDDGLWSMGRGAFVYGVDSCATAMMRLAVTPVSTVQATARKGRRVGGVPGAVVGGSVGLVYGLPRGVVGAGVSLGTGVWSFYVAAVAEVVGVVAGTGQCLGRGASAVDGVFTERRGTSSV